MSNRKRKRKEALVIDAAIEADLWGVYLQEKTQAARDALVSLYYPAVRATARVIKSSFAKRSITLDADDLTNDGVIGLMTAIERFEPERGFKFLTFAQTRIRGAMVDTVRQQDWVPRAERRARADTPAILSAELAQEQVDASVAFEDSSLSTLDCQEELASVLECLTVRQRRVFDLYVGDGMPIGRVCVKLRVSPAYVVRVRELVEKMLRDALAQRVTARETPQADPQCAA